DAMALKSAVIVWVEQEGFTFDPPINPSQKSDRGFTNNTTGKFLCPVGMNWLDISTRCAIQRGEIVIPSTAWPMMLYNCLIYYPNDPWNGFLHGQILVKTYMHIFVSPSTGRDIENFNSAVTISSIAYAATQARHALSPLPTLAMKDHKRKLPESRVFYGSLMQLLEDLEQKHEVEALISWWNQCDALISNNAISF
ncbi:hypothetical protein BDQ12DRAFT_614002, partial [Crucibulum laeve]